ncbi:PDZ domain-containing protein [Chryseobacterium sp. SNU WT5]|uniref:trypsin-like peptidase domain-containing protein n=1 Tax=Chryseobacterium sp. SNU WT5 TaxID=2594269 RepID=UPI00117E1433|nr:trypsin-like peptidase domain-containing protein [Chryseobacterium sp. SNU WT5]QDP85649.1 PDZ domain-containing protein [Chryseobacterium sp. SNU WT5]
MKNTLKKLIPYAVVGVLSGATTVGAFTYFNVKDVGSDYSYFAPKNSDAKYASFNMTGVGDDFVKAAKMTVPAVVSIKNFSAKKGRSNDQDLFDLFFGTPRSQQQQQAPPPNMPTGMGSGVIISPDGYIISNNHVIAGANKLEVVLSNKKSYIANLVGTDPTTDIALLKIEEKGLPYLNFGNSDNVEVGQWVLAVGNPMGLNSTVTAGIVSAKGRSIDLLSQQSRTPIESFIQTDAAINPGNSGGALVDPNGELIGINSAISSKTGYYEGYGFAVPANLARKVVEDIKKFGLVQRGFLGVVPLDLADPRQVAAYNQEKKTNLKAGDGVYLIQVAEKGGAEDAGLRSGDIVTKVDNTTISSYYDLSFAVGSKRPGDKVMVTYLRNGKTNTTAVTLKDQKGGTTLRSKADLTVTEKIGSEFEPLSEKFKTDYGLSSGVVAKNVVDGSEISKIGIVDNYIIIEVNGKTVNSQKDIEKILQGYSGNVQIKFVDEYGRITTKGFKMP